MSCLLSKCLYCRFLFLLICTCFPPKALCVFVWVCAGVPNPRPPLVLVTKQTLLQNILSLKPWSGKILLIGWQVSIQVLELWSRGSFWFLDYFPTKFPFQSFLLMKPCSRPLDLPILAHYRYIYCISVSLYMSADKWQEIKNPVSVGL